MEENITYLFNNSSFLTMTEDARSISNMLYEWWFIVPMYILIFLLSISGNCMVIATLVSNGRMRSVTNVFLLNLAVSDLLLGVFCLPFTLVGQMYRRFMFGETLCKLIPFLQAVSVAVDVWTLVAISLERYFAICRPFKSRVWQTQCHAYKMTGLVWALSLFINMPILFVSTLQPMSENAFKCREAWMSLWLERAFTLSLDAVLLLIPMLIMSSAYFLVMRKLLRGMRHEIQHNYNRRLLSRAAHSKSLTPTLSLDQVSSSDQDCCKNKGWSFKKRLKKVETHDSEAYSSSLNCMHTDMEFRHVVHSTNIEKSIESKRKVLWMLFVIIIEFFVCWTPLHVLNTIHLYSPKNVYQYIGSKGVLGLQLLAFCSSCCNPITYCFMNHNFRQAFIGLIQSCRIRRRRKSECKQVRPPPSSQEVTARVIRGSQTGRTDLAVLEMVDCV